MPLRTRAALAALLTALAACSDSSGPGAGPPSKITLTAAPSASASVASSAGTMAVRVTDASGNPVAGATVSFTASGGATATPASAVTDGDGMAQTGVTLGTISGPVTITATVAGTASVVTVNVSAAPGPVRSLTVSPKSKRLFALGDTVRVTASALDEYGNAQPTSAVSYSLSDPSLATVDATGLVRVIKQGGTELVIVSAAGRADTATISIAPAGTTACTGAATPTTIGVGASVVFSAVHNGCLPGGAAGAEYALVAYNSTLTGGSALATSVLGEDVGSAPSSALLPPAIGLASRIPLARGASASAMQLDEGFHLRLQARSRTALAGRAAQARAWYRARRGSAGGAMRSISGTASTATIPSAPTVGAIVRLNVNANDACAAPDYHGARIVAVGTHSIVLADTLNPTGGFTDAAYQRFAARFDTLVYPLDVDNFGAPSDIDGNGRVAILFTRAVNELTAAGSSSFVGGFFFGRDLYPVVGDTATACAGSNEGEMFYMLAPDPKGVVNGNVFRTGFVDTLTTGVLAHEFQHLINASRRLYVNNAPVDAQDEVVWLNEGLSHVAEELLYYRESGLGPRRNLTDAAIRTDNKAIYAFFKADASANFSRFASYLAAPAANSPVADNDELATRGATWSFLRYAVDQLNTTDAAVWFRFVNSTTTGLGTLRYALGRDPAPLFQSWAVANYADDHVTSVDATLTHPSWNFRDIYGNTFGSYDATHTVFTPLGYPLTVTQLVDGTAVADHVQGGSAAYYTLGVSANHEALLTFGGVSTPPAALKFIVVRTR